MTEQPPAADGVGKSIDQVKEEAPDESAVADALGFSRVVQKSSESSSTDDRQGKGLFIELDDASELLVRLAEQHQELSSRVAELERENGLLREKLADTQELVSKQQKTLKDITGLNNDLQGTVKDVEEKTEKTRAVAQSAIAKVNQLEADADTQEDAENLPHGIEPSTSPLDFFANCRQQKVKEIFVERQQKPNTYRAIRVAKWWDEFATIRSDGSGVFYDREGVKQALTALLNKEPHPQTVSRVWDKLVDFGGKDVTEKTRQVGRRQEKKEILSLNMETAEGLLEQRYIGLDLLEDTPSKVASGGVTPVVTTG